MVLGQRVPVLLDGDRGVRLFLNQVPAERTLWFSKERWECALRLLGAGRALGVTRVSMLCVVEEGKKEQEGFKAGQRGCFILEFKAGRRAGADVSRGSHLASEAGTLSSSRLSS